MTTDLIEEKEAHTKEPVLLNIEGKEIPWDKPTITADEIARLGGWEPSQGVIVVDKDNFEITLSSNEVIELKPGISFGKRIRWKRGLMRERICQELVLLKLHYGQDVEYIESGDWFLIPRYSVPQECQPSIASVCFSLKPGYPGAEPYGFFITANIRFKGLPLTAAGAPSPPPFPGNWIFISWSPDGWLATADVVTGANLWAWARSFAARLKEGV